MKCALLSTKSAIQSFLDSIKVRTNRTVIDIQQNKRGNKFKERIFLWVLKINTIPGTSNELLFQFMVWTFGLNVILKLDISHIVY